MASIEADDPVWALFGEGGLDGGGDDGACPHCGARGSPAMLDGNMTCASCNTVLGRHLDHSAEWRVFATADGRGGGAPARCCPPTSALLPSLGCTIGGRARRTRGAEPGRMRMVQRYQMWSSRSYRERTLCSVFDVLTASAAQHGVPPSILEEAKTLYKSVSQAKIWRGENRAGIVATSLFVACRRSGVPRSTREVARMFNVRTETVTRGCRAFSATLEPSGADADCTGPLHFVNRFCCRLGLGAAETRAVREVVERAQELAVATECMPPSLVAGALAFVGEALGLGLSRKDVAEACLLSQVTVAKCHRRLAAARKQLLPGLEAGPG